MTLDEFFKKHGDVVPVKVLREAIGAKSDEQVRQWARNWRNRRPSPRYCVAIERATNNLVTRQDLRPDDWRQIWPELAKQEAAP